MNHFEDGVTYADGDYGTYAGPVWRCGCGDRFAGESDRAEHIRTANEAEEAFAKMTEAYWDGRAGTDAA